MELQRIDYGKYINPNGTERCIIKGEDVSGAALIHKRQSELGGFTMITIATHGITYMEPLEGGIIPMAVLLSRSKEIRDSILGGRFHIVGKRRF